LKLRFRLRDREEGRSNPTKALIELHGEERPVFRRAVIGLSVRPIFEYFS